MRFRKKLLLILLVSFMTACAAPRAIQKYSRIPAIDYKINKSKTVSLSFGEAWDNAVQALSSTFYTINNIEKNSRIINVSFRLSDPAKYIDCGISKRVITYNEKANIFEYETAGSNEHDTLWETKEGYSIWSEVNRDNSVTGAANIYFTPLSESKTSITININYLLKTKLSGKNYSYRNGGEYLFDSNFSDVIETEITTNRPSMFGGNNPEVVCKSNQTLEKQLLSTLTSV